MDLSSNNEDNEKLIQQLKAQAESLQEAGKIKEFLKVMKKYLQLAPNDYEGFYHYGEVLSELNNFDEAESVLSYIPTSHPLYNKILQLKETFPDRNQQLYFQYNDALIERYLELYRGRDGVYAQQFGDGRNFGYKPIYAPYNKNVVTSHMDGDITTGLYFMRHDNTVFMTCIDLDVCKEKINELLENGTLFEQIKDDAGKICNILKKHDIPYLLEDSGYKGMHFWFFFNKAIQAKEARQFLNNFMTEGQPNPNFNWEIFPKQDIVPYEKLGNLVKVPLGIHLKTGKRCFFMDPETFTFHKNQEEALMKVQYVNYELIKKSFSFSVSNKIITPRPASIQEPESVPARLKEYCSVVDIIIQKAKEQHHLAHNERVVLLYIFAFLGKDGRDYLHWIISNCDDYNFYTTEKYIQNIRPNPMSCPRIRSWIPDLAKKIACICNFNFKEGEYPSPLLHLGEIKLQYNPKDLKKLVQDYFKILNMYKICFEKKKHTEEILEKLFKECQGDKILTDDGFLKRCLHGDTIYYQLISQTYFPTEGE